MDIDKLKIFLTVIDLGSINKAAEKLNYSQAGVSYVIQAVEKDFGLTLLKRSSKGVSLNEHGQLLIKDIRKLVDTSTRLEGLVSGIKSQQHRSIHIATFDFISIKWLPKALTRFRQIRPDVYVNTTAGGPQFINDLLDDSSADIGLLEKGWVSNKYRWRKLVEDRFYGVFPKGSIDRDCCYLTDFENRKFFIPDYMRERNIERLIRDNQIDAEILQDKASIFSIIHTIAEGYGSSIISALSINLCNLNWNDTDNLPDILPLEPFACRELGASIREEKKDDEDVKFFIKCLQEVIHESCTHAPERGAYVVNLR